MWIPPVVRWDPGERRELRFAVENVSNRTVALAEPDPALARVDIYSGPENDLVCGTSPPPGPVAPRKRVELAPGDRIEVVVDLGRACGGVAPGVYRFVASYRAPAPGPGARLWAGALPARHGNVVVERGTAAARCPPCPPERPARPRKAPGEGGAQ